MADSQADLDAVQPPIIMQVHSPAEGDENEDNEANEKAENPINSQSSESSNKSPANSNAPSNIPEEKPSQSSSYFTQVCPASSTNSSYAPQNICSPFSTPQVPKFDGNPFARSANTKISAGIIVTSSNPQVKPFSLKPSNFNPFKKPEDKEIENASSNNKPVNFNPFRKIKSLEKESNGNASEQEKAVSSTTYTNGDLKFVPLVENVEKTNESIVKPATNPVPIQSTSTPSFVFGQNLQERVIGDKNDEAKPSTSCIDSNGTNDMLFSNALKETVKAEEPHSSTSSKEAKSLSESAREYEESRAVKRKYEEVEVKTGEEEETNIIQISCKLFSYDLGNWAERGRGTLRLNDFEVTENGSSFMQSRLVFRTAGSLRVIINTKIWDSMLVQQASAKSIRVTAMDSAGLPKLFLVMASPEDSKMLFRHLDDRINTEKERQKHKKSDDLDESSDCDGQINKKMAVDLDGHNSQV